MKKSNTPKKNPILSFFGKLTFYVLVPMLLLICLAVAIVFGTGAIIFMPLCTDGLLPLLIGAGCAISALICCILFGYIMTLATRKTERRNEIKNS